MFCPLEFHIIYFLTNMLCDLGQLICFLFFFNPPDFPFTFTQNEVNICFSYKILWHYNTLIEVKITTGFFVDTLSLVSYLTLPYPYTDHASGSVKNRIMWKVKWCFKRWLMSVTYVMRKRIKKNTQGENHCIYIKKNNNNLYREYIFKSESSRKI